MNALLSIHWILAASIWYFVNGLLHDVFVVANHKGKYDRDLLRLLLDGHVLLLSGAIVFVCYLSLLQHQQAHAAMICVIAGLFMLIYCALIFPFLKSFVTIAISIMLIVVAIKLALPLLMAQQTS
jgi:hypothetical protein